MFSPPDGFESGMAIKFLENVLHVIVDGCATDVQLIGYCAGRFSTRQQPENL
jgi:hypothetical protein